MSIIKSGTTTTTAYQVEANTNGDLVFQTAGSTALTISSNQAFSFDGAAVFNEAGADKDFRVEGDTDANLLFVDASTDKVGMGTNTPGSKLDVVSTAASTQQIRINNASTASGAYAQFRADGDATSAYFGVSGTGNAVTGGAFDGDFAYLFTDSNAAGLNVGTSSAVPLKFYTNNTLRSTLDSAGNLGLGVTPSAWFTSSKVLQVSGAAIEGRGTVAQLYCNGYLDATAANEIYINNGFSTKYRQSDGEHRWYQAASGTAGGNISYTNTLTLDASGNLGVGTTTPGSFASETDSKLTVGTGSGNTGAITLYSGTTGHGAINWADGTSGAATYAGILRYDHSANAMQFYTNGLNERARITSGGNFMLTSGGQIELNVSTLSSKGAISAFNTDSTNGGLVFKTEASGTLTERARITSGGNLLVGTTSSSAASGEGFKLIPEFNGANSPGFAIVTSQSSNSTASMSLYSTGAGAYRFYVADGGTIYATNTSITGISDQRLKENIRDLDVGLDAVLSLKPRKFDWKAGKGKDIKGDRGFIAQEFEQIFPDLVDEWKDPVPEGEEPYKAVRQDLIPVLVKAIQEQQAMIEDLKAKVAALEGAN